MWRGQCRATGRPVGHTGPVCSEAPSPAPLWQAASPAPLQGMCPVAATPDERDRTPKRSSTRDNPLSQPYATRRASSCAKQRGHALLHVFSVSNASWYGLNGWYCCGRSGGGRSGG